MQLTLVATQLRIGGEPSPGAASGADDSLGPPLSITTLAAYVQAQPELRGRWQVTLRFGHAGLDRLRWEDDFVEEILATRPDVLGLSCFCWDLDAHLELATRVKARRPETLIVLGGPSVNGQTEALLRRCPGADVAINGEGESRLVALLRDGPGALARMSQTAWRGADGEVHGNGGVFPHLELAEIPSPYSAGIVRPATSQAPYVETSRGCVNRCRFCAWRQRTGGVRRAPYERLRDEVRWAREGGYRRLFLVDSAINDSREHLESVVRGFEEGDPGGEVGLVYFISHRSVDREELALLGRLRTENSEVGLDTLNENALRVSGRPPVDPEDFSRRLHLLAELGPVAPHLMLGMPGDSLPELRRTVDYTGKLIREIGEDRFLTVRAFWMVIAPGTHFWEQRERYGIQIMPEGIPYLRQSDSLSRRDLIEVARIVADSPLAPLVHMDGPPDILEEALRGRGTLTAGMLTPGGVQFPREGEALGPSPGDSVVEPPESAEVELLPAPITEAELRVLLRPLHPGRELRRGWSVSRFVTSDSEPTVVLEAAGGVFTLAVQIGRESAWRSPLARTRHYALRRLPTGDPSGEQRRAGEVEAILAAIIRLIARNEEEARAVGSQEWSPAR